MKVTFCGVRGSMATPGADFLKYGGQTSCVAVSRARRPPELILDAGTGLVSVTPLLGHQPYDGSILLGHLHWDHTQGMPFFDGGGAAGSRVDVLIPAQGGPGQSAHDVLAGSFSPPHFPIVPSQLGPGWTFAGLEEGRYVIDGFEVLAREVPHKGGRTFGFRVEDATSCLTYISDHSPTSMGPGPDGLGERHEAALDLARDTDVLIHDAQHLAGQFPGVGFLGHASVEYCVELAREAGVATLVLFHHAPSRTDDEVDALLHHAQTLAAGELTVLAAYEGLVMDLPSPTDRPSEGTPKHAAGVQEL